MGSEFIQFTRAIFSCLFKTADRKCAVLQSFLFLLYKKATQISVESACPLWVTVVPGDSGDVCIRRTWTGLLAESGPVSPSALNTQTVHLVP